MAYQIEVSDRPAKITLGIRKSSAAQDLPQVIPQICIAIMQYMGQNDPQDIEDAFVAYYNMDMQNLDVEIGFTTTKEVPGQGNIQRGSIPGGKAASVLHVGPYNGLGAAHDALHRWMAEKGFESATGYYELYLNDPQNTLPEALKTEVFTLLKTS
jgi:effector-binding domain-containing protein